MQKSLLMLIALAMLCGCATQTPNEGTALCDGTRKARVDHAENLAKTPDDAVALSGARLVALIDAACRS